METDIKFYKYFADYIQKHTGIIYQEKDYYRLDARFKNLMQEFKLSTVDELFNLFQQNVTAEMHQLLIDISTNNETYFLRDVKPFDALTKEVLPELQARGTMNLNIWSCACSTGQEVLSILMKIAEDCNDDVIRKTKILATDISTKALKKARAGVYDNLEAQRGLPAPLLIKYFKQVEGDKWQFDPSLHSKIDFQTMNLLEGPYKKNHFDIIFCRNVLIYQEREQKQVVLDKLYEALRPGGYFFMGSGESMIGMKTGFKSLKLKEVLIYQKPL